MSSKLLNLPPQAKHERPQGMPANDPFAVRRVRHAVQPPHQCPHCSSQVKLVNNSTIYGRPFGDWPWTYACTSEKCGSYVGTHPGTDIPLGTLATPVMRAARKRAKNVFNSLWESGQLSRSKAYAKLAEALRIPVESCHFGWFDAAQCHRAEQAAQALHHQLRRR